jgi:hypothetical protein
LRRRILSWWRSRISISSEARNNPISPHQLSLQSSIIEQKLHPIRCCSPPVVLGLRQGQMKLHHANWSSNALASFRTGVSKPSVNHP